MPHPAPDLLSWLAARGGVAHTAQIRDAGYSAHSIRSALDRGGAHWVRRSWLATTTGDPELARAARLGGRLTCVSAARRLGLWVPQPAAMPHPAPEPAAAQLHLAVPRTSSRHHAIDARLHWAVGPAPVGRYALQDPILNVLFTVARCLDVAGAAAVWESAIRLRHVDAAVLRSIRWRSTRAAVLAQRASALSDSGVETAFVGLMRGIGVGVRQQVPLDGHRVDGLIGERLVVQLDGFAHHQAADRRRDLRADARLVLRGFVVLRFDYQQVLFDPAFVVDTVAAAIAQGRHLDR